jgi:RNA polymerase sigma-70 factor (ECF subfamily)
VQEFSRDIIERAKKLDSKAIAAVFEHYYPKIYRYFVYRVRTNEDAEDQASEVFIKVVKAIKRQSGNFEAWLYRIAKNTLTDYYRRKGVRKETAIEKIILEAIPDKKVVNNDCLAQEELKKAIGRLSDDQQEVILLKFIEGYDNAEIAEITGKTIGAVKALQFRALGSLRGLMKEG